MAALHRRSSMSHAFPDEDRGAERVVFGDSAAYGVVVEPGGLGGFVFGAGAPGGGGRDQAAFFVPLEGLGGVFAAEFLDQPAMAVVEVAFVFVHPHEVVAHVAFLHVLRAVAQCRLGLLVQDIERFRCWRYLRRGISQVPSQRHYVITPQQISHTSPNSPS